jgi:hypothetical protein
MPLRYLAAQCRYTAFLCLRKTSPCSAFTVQTFPCFSFANLNFAMPKQIMSNQRLCRSQLYDTETPRFSTIAYPVLTIPQRFFAVQILCTSSHHWSLPLLCPAMLCYSETVLYFSGTVRFFALPAQCFSPAFRHHTELSHYSSFPSQRYSSPCLRYSNHRLYSRNKTKPLLLFSMLFPCGTVLFNSNA